MARTSTSSRTNDDDAPESQVAASVIGIRDLRADMAALVRRAGSGEHVIISVAGRSIARLGPLHTPAGQLSMDDLIASGHVIAPRRTGVYRSSDPVPVWQGSRIDKLLQDIR
jgi:prevent-host-death family protein